MSDDFRTLREASLAIRAVYSQLKIMTGIFVICVTLAAGAISGLYIMLFEIKGDASKIPGIEERLGRLDTKVDELRTKLEDLRVDVGTIKIAVKASDVTPQIVPGLRQIDAHAFKGWIGVPITDVQSASNVLMKYQPTGGRAWLYSTNTDFINMLSSKQPAPGNQP